MANVAFKAKLKPSKGTLAVLFTALNLIFFSPIDVSEVGRALMKYIL